MDNLFHSFNGQRQVEEIPVGAERSVDVVLHEGAMGVDISILCRLFQH
jgi:hypothetical protein